MMFQLTLAIALLAPLASAVSAVIAWKSGDPGAAWLFAVLAVVVSALPVGMVLLS